MGRSVLGQVRSECQVRECMSWDRCGRECPGTGEGASVSILGQVIESVLEQVRERV